MQNVMVVRTLPYIDFRLLISNTELAAKPSKFGFASEDSAAVILRNQDNSLTKLADSAAGTHFYLKFYRSPLTRLSGQFLQQRSYQGLEVRLGEDAPSILEQGRSGIARGYQDDHLQPE